MNVKKSDLRKGEGYEIVLVGPVDVLIRGMSKTAPTFLPLPS